MQKIEELLQEDRNAKRRREKYQKQSSLFSKLTCQLSVHDNRAVVSSYSNGSSEAVITSRRELTLMTWKHCTRRFLLPFVLILPFPSHQGTSQDTQEVQP